VVISLGPPTELAAMPDPRQPPAAFDAVIGGLHTAPAVLAHSGELSGMELDLTPAGARSLLGLPAGELGNLVVGFDEVIGPASAELREASGEMRTWPERFAVLDRFLCGRLERLRPVRSELQSAWQLIVSSGGAGRVSRVADAVGWSRRHLHERFLAEYGVSPKQLARIARFHRSSRILQRSPSTNLAALAAACGYYDQAHLARDWNQLAGCAPSRWMRTDELPFVQDGSRSELARLSA
jgi:AraC-like DNA-binding protein